MSAPEKITALSRTDLFASYGWDHDVLLPVVAVDGRGRSLVLDKRGDLKVATSIRPQGELFEEVVTR